MISRANPLLQDDTGDDRRCYRQAWTGGYRPSFGSTVYSMLFKSRSWRIGREAVISRNFARSPLGGLSSPSANVRQQSTDVTVSELRFFRTARWLQYAVSIINKGLQDAGGMDPADNCKVLLPKSRISWSNNISNLWRSHMTKISNYAAIICTSCHSIRPRHWLYSIHTNTECRRKLSRHFQVGKLQELVFFA